MDFINTEKLFATTKILFMTVKSYGKQQDAIGEESELTATDETENARNLKKIDENDIQLLTV